MQELVNLGHEQPPHSIRKIAHSLRSSSLNLGSVAFAESLVKIENIQEADFHRLREFIQEAQTQYLHFMEKLQAMI